VGEANLVSSIDFNNNNEMLANYMNGNPLLYKLNVDQDKSRFIQNPESCKYLSAFITENFESLRQNKKAEKLKKQADGKVGAATFTPTVTKLKTKANEFFKNEQFTKAIEYYSAGIALEPHPILFSNRALSYKKTRFTHGPIQSPRRLHRSSKTRPNVQKVSIQNDRMHVETELPDKNGLPEPERF
jgi:hypothetical protein